MTSSASSSPSVRLVACGKQLPTRKREKETRHGVARLLGHVRDYGIGCGHDGFLGLGQLARFSP
jgi:hypothetical protein